MKNHIKIFITIFFFAILPVMAIGSPARWQKIKSHAESITLAQHMKLSPTQTKQLKIPPINQHDRVFIAITARRDAPRLQGYNWPVRYLFNGHPLDAARNRRSMRLVNKPVYFTRRSGQRINWNVGDGIWQLFFSPSFNTDVSRYCTQNEQDPYTIILDVTDMLRSRTTKKPNVLTIHNTYTHANVERYKAKGRDANLTIVASVRVLTVPKDNVAQNNITKPLMLRGQPNVHIDSTGGFSLVFDNTVLPFVSTFSYPDGGYNKLGTVNNYSSEENWHPHYQKISNDKWQISAKGKYYSLNRIINLYKDHVQIRDKFINLTNHPIGIRLSNHLDFTDLPIYTCRMAGLPSQTLNNVYQPANPTLFYPLRHSSLGIVADDDVYRNQAYLYYDLHKRTTGLRDNFFAIAPNDSYTLKWSIYFLHDDNYYTFVNHVRKDWGANYTIQGPVYFVNYDTFAHKSDVKTRQLLTRHNVHRLIFWNIKSQKPVKSWGDKKVVAMGTGLMNPIFKDERKLLRESIERVRRVAPQVQISFYSHLFFVSPERPNDQSFRDSWITDAQGSRMKSRYKGRYYPYRTVYPTLTNSYGKAYLKLLDFYLNDLGLNNLYIDESNGPGVTVSNAWSKIAGVITYNTWDGHSARINPKTKRIESKFAILSLVTRPFFAEVVKHVKEHGGRVLFNNAPTTHQRLKFQLPSFVETHTPVRRSFETDLSTPLAYGRGDPSMQMLRVSLRYGMIWARTYLNYHSSVVDDCYPFTPIALHSGWVKGQERIITSKSGSYGWDNDTGAGKLLLFNSDRKLSSQKHINNIKHVTIQVPKGGIAILERE